MALWQSGASAGIHFGCMSRLLNADMMLPLTHESCLRACVPLRRWLSAPSAHNVAWPASHTASRSQPYHTIRHFTSAQPASLDPDLGRQLKSSSGTPLFQRLSSSFKEQQKLTPDCCLDILAACAQAGDVKTALTTIGLMETERYPLTAKVHELLLVTLSKEPHRHLAQTRQILANLETMHPAPECYLNLLRAYRGTRNRELEAIASAMLQKLCSLSEELTPRDCVALVEVCSGYGRHDLLEPVLTHFASKTQAAAADRLQMLDTLARARSSRSAIAPSFLRLYQEAIEAKPDSLCSTSERIQLLHSALQAYLEFSVVDEPLASVRIQVDLVLAQIDPGLSNTIEYKRLVFMTQLHLLRAEIRAARATPDEFDVRPWLKIKQYLLSQTDFVVPDECFVLILEGYLRSLSIEIHKPSRSPAAFSQDGFFALWTECILYGWRVTDQSIAALFRVLAQPAVLSKSPQRIQIVERIFQHIPETGLKPTASMYAPLFPVFTADHEATPTNPIPHMVLLDIEKQMLGSGIAHNFDSASAAVMAYWKGFQPTYAMRRLSDMELSGIRPRPSVGFYVELIRHAAPYRHLALFVLQDLYPSMLRQRIAPNHKLYSELLRCCLACGNQAQGHQIMIEMRDKQIALSADDALVLLELMLATDGVVLYHGAQAVIRRMKQSGVTLSQQHLDVIQDAHGRKRLSGDEVRYLVELAGK